MIYMALSKSLAICKIGYSSDVKNRIEAINFASPVEIVLYTEREGGFKTERAIHEALADYHVRYEWFKFLPEVVEIFDRVPTIDIHTKYSLNKLENKKTSNENQRTRLHEKWTSVEIEALRELWQINPCFDEIADKLGRSRGAIYAALYTRGIISPKRRNTCQIRGAQ